MILRWVNLHAVSYCAEISPQIGISQRKLYQIRKYLTHGSVAQAGSNDEKKWRSKISLDCPFNIIVKVGTFNKCSGAIYPWKKYFQEYF